MPPPQPQPAICPPPAEGPETDEPTGNTLAISGSASRFPLVWEDLGVIVTWKQQALCPEDLRV